MSHGGIGTGISLRFSLVPYTDVAVIQVFHIERISLELWPRDDPAHITRREI